MTAKRRARTGAARAGAGPGGRVARGRAVAGWDQLDQAGRKIDAAHADDPDRFRGWRLKGVLVVLQGAGASRRAVGLWPEAAAGRTNHRGRAAPGWRPAPYGTRRFGHKSHETTIAAPYPRAGLAARLSGRHRPRERPPACRDLDHRRPLVQRRARRGPAARRRAARARSAIRSSWSRRSPARAPRS